MIRRKNKSKIIAFLFVGLIFMGIGYAVLQSNLNISGTAKASGLFNVEIIGVTPNSSSSYTPTTATLSPMFSKPGDFVEYTVQVQNKGTIDALINVTLDSSDNVTDLNNNEMFLFEVEYENGKKLLENEWEYYELNAGITTNLKVTITYNSKAVNFPSRDVEFELILNVTQKSSTESKEAYRQFMEDKKDFDLDADGKIIGYNPSVVTDENGYVVVGAVNYEGRQITEITNNSFIIDNSNIYVLSASESFELYIDYPRGSSEYNSVINVLESMGIEEDTSVQGTNSIDKAKIEKLINIIPELKKMDTTYARIYGKGEIEKPTEGGLYINLATGSIGNGQSIEVVKLDLSGATNLQVIGSRSFANSNLSNVKFPQNGRLTTIGSEAFKNAQLEGIILPSTVTNIGEKAFANNQLSGTLTIPNSVTSIGNNAFGPEYYDGTNRISSIAFENNSSLQTIGSYAFYNNQLSGSLTIPNSVTSIGEKAFSTKSNSSQTITTLTLGTGLTTIGANAFQYTTTPNLIIQQYASGIGSTFNTKYTGVVNLSIQSGIISANAFDSQSNKLNSTVTSLTIGSGVTSIGENTFANNEISSLNLTNATSLQTIGNGAFRGNKIVGSLIIPASVTNIGNYAFGPGTNYSNNSNRIATLTFASNNNLESIGERAFYDNLLSSLTIPASVTNIGNGAFSDNRLSGTLTIPANVINIGDGAFSGTSGGLTNVIDTLIFESGSHLQTIGEYAFHNNQLTGTLKIPASVITIGRSAFSGSNSASNNMISSLIFESGSHLETIGQQAFAYNQISNTIIIPSSVVTIGIGSFKNNHISSIDLLNATSLEYICDHAFYENQLNMASLTIPNNVLQIEEYAFASTSSYPQTITTLTLGTGLTYVKDYAFSNTVTNLIMPQYVTNVASSSFKTKYEGVVSLTIQSGSIPFHAFYSLASYEPNSLGNTVKTLTLGDGVTSVGEEAFKITHLETINIGSGLVSASRSSFSGPIQTVNINMTESEWDSRGFQSMSYIIDSGNPPTVNYLPE